MAIPKSYPARFTPKGVCDAFDATDRFAGACRNLKDLIFDQANPELVVSRPGVTQLTDFTGFNTPGFVSIEGRIGTLVYGMVATAANAGKDEPFCYDLVAGAFIAISGVLAGNTPTSPATTGAWTPPTMAMVGVYIIITHPGFNGVGTNFFGVIDTTVPGSPAWSTQDMTTTPMGVVPTAVANFNNRAYFAFSGNLLAFSDVLLLKRTSATQQLTIGDNEGITTLCGLPITTTSSGIVGALLVFKQTQIWQVTGDAASTPNPLSLNYLSLNVGTMAPRSVVQSPLGVYFCSSDAPYFVDPLGTVRVVTNNVQDIDPDVSIAWINCTQHSRMAAAYAGSIYRICMPTVINGTAKTVDYWFDEHRRRWSGPHSFAYDCATSNGNNFILTSAANPAKLIASQSAQNTTSVFTDLGVAQSPDLLSCTFPKAGRMTEKQVCESTQELSASGGNITYQVEVEDEQGNVLGSVGVAIVNAGGVWTLGPGAPFWGAGLNWVNSWNIPHVYSLPWTAPLVFKKMALHVTATASAQLQIGTHYARYQDTGYTNLTAPNTP